jgi:hypothetical protein
MNGSLSHGLARLGTSGNKIVEQSSGRQVLLKGVNRSGLEYSAPGEKGFLAAAGIDQVQIRQIVENWGSNILRVPFNQDWAMNGCGGQPAETYLSAIDQMIDWAASAGCYTLLDLQWLDAHTAYGHLHDGSPNFVAPLPNQLSLELWPMLANRYRDEPAVLFDVFNEPHNRLDDDPHALNLVANDGTLYEADQFDVRAEEWLPWARKLVEVIRGAHPQSLIWVPGVDWAYDLRGIELDAENIVYSAHVYPNRLRWHWRSRFGYVGVDRPLFLGEFGGGSGDLEWGERLLGFLEDKCCGWTAWSWADHPRLVENAQRGDHRPTLFGDFVRRAMTRARTAAASGHDVA